jgi:hypothetical protein
VPLIEPTEDLRCENKTCTKEFQEIQSDDTYRQHAEIHRTCFGGIGHPTYTVKLKISWCPWIDLDSGLPLSRNAGGNPHLKSIADSVDYFEDTSVPVTV